MIKWIVLAALAACLFLAALQAGSPQEPGGDQSGKEEKKEAGQAFLHSLAGRWEGTCRTWFQPGRLADESKIEGRIFEILGGPFMRHEYEGEILKKPRKGEETLIYNPQKERFQVSWIDDFHMNYGILFSEGKPSEGGFTVSGEYDTSPGAPPWGWKTVYRLEDEDRLFITAYNIPHGGQEAKAMEVQYTRVKE